jgi:hypothetical protein
MKRTFTKLGTMALAISLMLSYAKEAKSQDAAGQLLQGGVDDATTLLRAYLNPFGQSFGANLNSGWYNTAQPLKPGRFELKFVGNITFTPNSARTFDLTGLGLQTPREIQYHGQAAYEYWDLGNTTTASTVFGPGIVNGETGAILTKRMDFINPQTGETETMDIASIPLPPGSGIAINPLPPAAQLSIGLVKGTELMLRFTPSFNASNVKFGQWGVGLKHDIKQWIPIVSMLPFDLSLIGAYSRLNLSVGLPQVLPGDPANFADPNAADTDYEGLAFNADDYANQRFGFNTSAFNLNLIISKKISVLTVYGGLRYAHSVARMGVYGTYGFGALPYYNTDTSNPSRMANDPNNGKLELQQVTDPIDVDMRLSQIGVNGGFRLKLGFISLFSEATISRFSTVSAGVGFGWMN